jgi:hypothetical protein
MPIVLPALTFCEGTPIASNKELPSAGEMELTLGGRAYGISSHSIRRS